VSVKQCDDSSLLEGALEDAIRQLSDASHIEMLSYAVFPAGKRIRPNLFLKLVTLFGAEITPDCFHVASALELLHCASLIHDDLPSIDNDLMRRGKPAFHVKYGVANAVLSGDLLYALAIREIGRVREQEQIPQLLPIISDAHMRIQVGQLLDIKNTRDINELQRIHHLKTSALFEACTLSAYVLRHVQCGVEYEEVKALGTAFGNLFQLLNDLNDSAQTEQYARASGSDIESGRGSVRRFAVEERAGLQETARKELAESLEAVIQKTHSKKNHDEVPPDNVCAGVGELGIRSLMSDFLNS
jgi:geranylgeranyl diphosphate synthase type II